jgi:hypothetical protein
VPFPGFDGDATLGSEDVLKRVSVLGIVRRYRGDIATDHRWVQSVVTVLVHGESESRDIAVERFVR